MKSSKLFADELRRRTGELFSNWVVAYKISRVALNMIADEVNKLGSAVSKRSDCKLSVSKRIISLNFAVSKCSNCKLSVSKRIISLNCELMPISENVDVYIHRQRNHFEMLDKTITFAFVYSDDSVVIHPSYSECVARHLIAVLLRCVVNKIGLNQIVLN